MIGEPTFAFQRRFFLMVKRIFFIVSSRKFYIVEAKLLQIFANFCTLLGLEAAMLKLDRVDLDADGERFRNTALDLIDDASNDTGTVHECASILIGP